jgi:hypothetical protein
MALSNCTHMRLPGQSDESVRTSSSGWGIAWNHPQTSTSIFFSDFVEWVHDQVDGHSSNCLVRFISDKRSSSKWSMGIFIKKPTTGKNEQVCSWSKRKEWAHDDMVEQMSRIKWLTPWKEYRWNYYKNRGFFIAGDGSCSLARIQFLRIFPRPRRVSRRDLFWPLLSRLPVSRRSPHPVKLWWAIRWDNVRWSEEEWMVRVESFAKESSTHSLIKSCIWSQILCILFNCYEMNHLHFVITVMMWETLDCLNWKICVERNAVTEVLMGRREE